MIKGSNEGEKSHSGIWLRRKSGKMHFADQSRLLALMTLLLC